MIDKIVKETTSFKERIAELKEKSSYYPEVVIEEYPNDHPESDRVVFASTLVRIERDGKWYAVHCVESVVPTKTTSEKHLLIRLMDSVHKLQHLYKITGQFEDVDSLQKSEMNRLIEIENERWGKKEGKH